MLHAYGAEPDAFTSTPEERAQEPLEWWTRRVCDPAGSGVGFGAFDGDGTLCGSVTLEYPSKPKTRHKAHLIGMFVREPFRGIGLGGKLVEAALHHARDVAHAHAVTLTVTQGNASAIRLYQAWGFREWGVEPLAILTPRGYLEKVHMTCVLGAR
jgi:GNAT superfamily N-acetyltransferase